MKLENNQILKVKGLTKNYKLGIFNRDHLINEIKNSLFKKNKNFKNIADVNNKNLNILEKFKTISALDNLSFDLNRGTTLALLGKNGSGKSTLLKILSRITTPTKGEIIYKGKLISILEQGVGMDGNLTARDNIYIQSSMMGYEKKYINERIEKIIEFSEIPNFMDTPVKRFSSGMLTRLGFSIAVHLDPEILIIDEVLAVGDLSFRKKCLNKIEQLSNNQQQTIIFVSHEVDLVRQICNHSIVLEKGKKIFDGDIKDGINFYKNSSNN